MKTNNESTVSQPFQKLGLAAISSLSLAGLALQSTTAFGEPTSSIPVVNANLKTEARAQTRQVHFRSIEIEGQTIAYREAGPKGAPTVLLLHGFPTSSHMFRNLIPDLADRYHVLAPDYPGYGQSSMPSVDEFDYSFDHFAEIIETFTERLDVDHYSLYLMDYGAPIGFRLAVRHPEKVDSLLVQNGNAYEEGLQEFWKPIRSYWKDRSKKNADALRSLLTLEATKWQYTHGTRDEERISPDNWTIDQSLLDRTGNQEIQLAMFHSYGSNPPLYPSWQAYLRKHQPPTLITWGKNDVIFPGEGALAYRKDLKDAEIHLLDTGHFALEEDGGKIGNLILDFLDRKVSKQRKEVRQ
jgi:pimeloyl-ACP methyl ester carboxylesterase